MEQLHVAICEDQLEEQTRLLTLIEQSGELVRCDRFCCGEDLLSRFQRGKYDLIFMDIYMSGISGVETVTGIGAIALSLTIATMIFSNIRVHVKPDASKG